MSNSSSATNYSAYDQLGRVTQGNQVTAGNTYPFTYSYNLAGAMTGETYPSGRQLTFSYDGANRVSEIQGVIGGQTTPYLANMAYAPHGGFTQYEYGNTLWRQQTFDNRCRPRNRGMQTRINQTPAPRRRFSICNITGART